jgi:hypothetical protein
MLDFDPRSQTRLPSTLVHAADRIVAMAA